MNCSSQSSQSVGSNLYSSLASSDTPIMSHTQNLCQYEPNCIVLSPTSSPVASLAQPADIANVADIADIAPRTLSFLKKPSPVELACILSKCSIQLLREWCGSCHVQASGPRNSKASFVSPLLDRFWMQYTHYSSLDVSSLRKLCLPLNGSTGLATTLNGLVYSILTAEFPEKLLRKLINVGPLNKATNSRIARADLSLTQNNVDLADDQSIIESWPQPIDVSFALSCCDSYSRATCIKPPKPCACCGRAFLASELAIPYAFSFNQHTLETEHPLKLLNSGPFPSFPLTSPFSQITPILDGLMLYYRYIDIDMEAHVISVTLCNDCSSSLKSSKMPKFSLRNNLFRGELPDDLKDITWIEEKICALHRVTADVARLHNAEQDERLPYRLVGNTCSHPVNVPSTASVLPRIPADINDNLTVVFVGAKFDQKQLPPMFRVRRRVIERFLAFLAASNPLYADVNISQDNLNLYPDDDTLPLLEHSVILNDALYRTDILAQETASFEDHPAINSNSSGADEAPNVPAHHLSQDVDSDATIESTGAIDFRGTTVSGHSATATAVFNLLRPRKPDTLPDLILPRGTTFVNDYDNPALFPGMFPTLFPFGMGGIEAHRETAISFQEHANYLISLHEPAFKTHRLFLFVALSIIKKRRGHLQTAFTVKKRSFDAVADVLSSVTAETLKSTAHHLEQNRPPSEMSPLQRDAYNCLRQLNVVSGSMPGSPASKLFDRSAIRGYFGLHGLPHIYLTMNPSAAHSPVLQVYLGDAMVDLSERCPSMPLPEARAKRIAKDPVAAADFFAFCIKMFLKHMLGFDPDTGVSRGGILGHIKSYYGKCECTMRGCLHAHFVIWLLGGLNPREVHDKLEKNEGFKARFFQFWEQIIKHDAPYEEIEIDSSVEPRTQRPPPTDQDKATWESTFQFDVKLCAEKLQRHNCRDVCWKYSNVKHLPRELRPCRFQFPHEVVPDSYYDVKAKSIVMACRDPTMNFYNEYMLVFCRHNHDIRNIASGKGAKAAMFYITNYMTKDDLHSHQILSMMSSTIAHMKERDDATPVDRAKARLQRWLSQLSRLQEVHAQMAVLYLRGIGDTFASHQTIPMLSCTLLHHLRSIYPELSIGSSSTDAHEEDSAEDRVEPSSSHLRRAQDGRLFTDVNQVDDYIHRDEQLRAISFFEFVCCMRKEKSLRTTSTRLGSLQRFSLQSPHPQCNSHTLVMQHSPNLPLHRWKTPPRVIGMQIPTESSKEYELFMLGHFKPFSYSSRLIRTSESCSSEFKCFSFPDFATTIMQNWKDIHECEDERDAERIRKRQNGSKGLAAMNERIAALAEGYGDDDNDDENAPVMDFEDSNQGLPGHLLNMVMTLKNAGWLEGEIRSRGDSAECTSMTIPRPSGQEVKEWSRLMKAQEEAIRRQRMNLANVENQLEYADSNTSMEPPSAIVGVASDLTREGNKNRDEIAYNRLPKTVATQADKPMETSDEIVKRIGEEMTLNSEQWIAYLIIARKFVADTVAASAKESLSPPLRLLLTGPGGTGKSHVVNTLKKLMTEYGMAHKLRLVAPTGSAASLIDATTIHKGLGIQVKRSKDAKNVNADNLMASLPVTRRRELEVEWGPAEWLFCDECSLLGASLNAELDQTLRLIKEKNDWYGGMNVVFAGDFSQYPPVKAKPLYEPIGPTSGSKTNSDYMNRLGRLAWLSLTAVVELVEQKRMRHDLEYGDAVARLRMRKCNADDVALFNSRVVASTPLADGVHLTPQESTIATTVVRDNRSRLYLNGLKAEALVQKNELVICTARDSRKNGTPMEPEERKLHLSRDFASMISMGALPSFIPLAVGMNVVLRNRNISSELKIANGSMGTLMALFTTSNGPYQSPDGAIVHFPASPVKLPDLPPGCVYVQPESKLYKASFHGELRTYRREQLLIEPAFAVTGHFSQGKTLPVVVADLKGGGGPAAYVAASRPTSRNGLFLLRAVTIDDLNHPPLPPNLLQELRRFDALKHNTLVEHGFVIGQKRLVPMEGCAEMGDGHGVTLKWEDATRKSQKRKRPSVNDHQEGDEDDDTLQKPPSKRQKTSTTTSSKRVRTHCVQTSTSATSSSKGLTSSTTHPNTFTLPTLRWDAANFSCAYDSLLMPLFAAWVSSPHDLGQYLLASHGLLARIAVGFMSVEKSPKARKPHLLHQVRQDLRRRLDRMRPLDFPLKGRHLVSLDDLIALLGLDRRLSFAREARCLHCRSESESVATPSQITLAYQLYTESLICLPCPIPEVVTVQEWIDAQLRFNPDQTCPRCQYPQNIISARAIGSSFPPILFLHSNPSTITTLRPSICLNLPAAAQGRAQVYTLTGITCYGGSHFTACILRDQQWWFYDGMRSAPSLLIPPGPRPASPELGSQLLDEMGTRNVIPTHYMYTISNP